MLRLRHLPLLALTAAALAGCGGGDGDAKGDPEPTPAARTYEAVPRDVALELEAKTPEERVRKILQVDPVLEQGPTKQVPGGCLYYKIPNATLANVFQYCFDADGGLSLLLTALTPSDAPAGPPDASEPRAALIGRANAVCQSQNGKLTTIGGDVARALAAYGRDESKATATAAAREIARFEANLRFTHDYLAAFEAPPDELETLDGYIDTIERQADLLEQSQTALVDGEDEEYDRLGDEFNAVGAEGKRLAREYGFATCSASTFG